MDDARKGDAALSASKPDEAIEHYTKALGINPTAVKYYIGRSTAYQRTSKYTEALHDAEVAVVLAKKRGSRELIKDAQFRRAVALFHLGRYADADFLLRIVKGLDEKDKMLPIWESKVASKLKDIPEGDEQKTVTIKEDPDVEIPSATTSTPAAKTEGSSTKQAPKPPAPTPKEKIKTDWYQSNDTVTLNILAKGVPKDKAIIEIEQDSVSVSFPIADSSSEYSYNADPLFAPVDPSQSKYRITPNKIEVTLRKATAGVKWHNLERANGDTATVATSQTSAAAASTAKETAPAYPTSSKSGAKNWDKLVVNDLDDKDEIEGDETSHFFKQLYSGATPEQQRAMMKSYSESGGTVLSTDWSNVGNRKVEPEPPEGMEAKKY